MSWHRPLIFLCLLTFLLFTHTARAESPKNVIFMIGDGMGLGQVAHAVKPMRGLLVIIMPADPLAGLLDRLAIMRIKCISPSDNRLQWSIPALLQCLACN